MEAVFMINSKKYLLATSLVGLLITCSVNVGQAMQGGAEFVDTEEFASGFVEGYMEARQSLMGSIAEYQKNPTAQSLLILAATAAQLGNEQLNEFFTLLEQYKKNPTDDNFMKCLIFYSGKEKGTFDSSRYSSIFIGKPFENALINLLFFERNLITRRPMDLTAYHSLQKLLNINTSVEPE
jgi:hypothetical protein